MQYHKECHTREKKNEKDPYCRFHPTSNPPGAISFRLRNDAGQRSPRKIPLIYGSSGGAMFLAKSGELIGIPSRVPVIGWGTIPITHMGLFIPIDRIYKWLEKENYDFLFDPAKSEKKSLELREERIKKAKENK